MKKTLSIKKLFFDKDFLSKLFVLAVPIILQNFINSFVNILDTVMIGRLGSIEIAAVGLGNQLFFLLNLLLYGVASGGMVFTAQFWGKKDLPGLRKAFTISMIFSIFFSTIFTVLCIVIPEEILSLYSNDIAVIKLGAKYLRLSALCFIPFSISFIFMFTLRSIEQVKLTVAITFISFSLNLVLNAVLIFGLLGFPKLGVQGAAIATVITRLIELFLFIITTKLNKYPILGNIKEHFAFDAKFFKMFLIIVAPVILNESIWSLGMTFHHKIFAGINTFSYAAFSISNTVAQLIWVIFVGLGNAISVLIGKRIGEGNYDEAKNYAYKIAVFSPFLAIFIGGMLIPISFVLPFIFNVEPEVIRIAKQILLILAICYPVKVFNMNMVIGVIRAGGDTRFGVIYDACIMWITSIPLALSLSHYAGISVWVVYLCLFADEPIKLCLGIWRLKSGKWLRSVV